MLVRRNSKPNFRSCLLTFQEKLSTNWLFESTRLRGSPEVDPGWAKKLLLPLGVKETRIMGSPEEWHDVGSELLHRPIELGSNFASWGKNPSAKRFQP